MFDQEREDRRLGTVLGRLGRRSQCVTKDERPNGNTKCGGESGEDPQSQTLMAESGLDTADELAALPDPAAELVLRHA